jgi:tRNA (cytidine/uridine-2'-O-)-methyltransferase
MFDVVLFEPEIPSNTGNIIRLCANTGTTLHLVRPLGFALDDKRMRRAGLDYHEFARLLVHQNWKDCVGSLHDRRVFAVSTKGMTRYDLVNFIEGDVFVFGPETRGLPDDILSSLPEHQRLRVPMSPESRSLNLSNTVAVVVYEAWRQRRFAGGG